MVVQFLSASKEKEEESWGGGIINTRPQERRQALRKVFVVAKLCNNIFT